MRFGVAMISSVFYPSIGGAQTHTLGLSQKLRARGVDVFVVTRHYQGLARYEEIDGVPTYRVGNGDQGKALAAITFIFGALRVLYACRHRYDILHCHLMISPMTIGLLARAIVGKPLVINPHRSGVIGDIGTLIQKRPLLGRLRLAAGRRWGNAFVSISRGIHAELRDIGVPEAKIWDIANGVDTERFKAVDAITRENVRLSLGVPKAPLVVFSGRLVKEKGLDVLLNAWPSVVAAVPEVHLVLVGEGEERANLVSQAQRLGVAEKVIFAGAAADVAAYLRAADVFVLPSRAEGLPVALLEAMACQLPCVGTNTSGTAQVLDNNVTGRLVPIDEPDALATGIIDALTLRDAGRWAQRAREHVAAHFSLNAVAERYIEMYEALLHKSSRSKLFAERYTHRIQG